MQIKVSQWGNSNALRLSKDMSEYLAVEKDTLIEVEFVEGGLLLKSAAQSKDFEYSLDQLLADSPSGSFDLNDEDRDWLDASPAGREHS